MLDDSDEFGSVDKHGKEEREFLKWLTSPSRVNRIPSSLKEDAKVIDLEMDDEMANNLNQMFSDLRLRLRLSER